MNFHFISENKERTKFKFEIDKPGENTGQHLPCKAVGGFSETTIHLPAWVAFPCQQKNAHSHAGRFREFESPKNSP